MKMTALACFAILLGITSCKTAHISIQVLKPAQITLPADVKTIAFVNRSLPDKKDRVKNVIEGAFTGESIFADRIGSEECIKGVLNGLNNSPRFGALMPTGVDLRGSGGRQFANPLDWETVERICKTSGADALACLEVFDSNNRTGMSNRKVTKKEKEKEITYVEYTATLNIDIESGWRVYFPASRQIIDQNIYNDSKSWSSTSDAGKKAEQGLPTKDHAVSEAGFYAGNQYARRISPLWIWVGRDYYKKANDDFERARRKVAVNDWKGAGELWEKYVSDSNPKIAGYACYNMALASEMDGTLEAAIEWAKKAYVDYKLKNARYYLNILQQRLNDQYRLDEQMKGVQ
jgi:hypothetical protein